MRQTEFEQIARSTRAKAVATALAYSVGKEEAEDVACGPGSDAEAVDPAWGY